MRLHEVFTSDVKGSVVRRTPDVFVTEAFIGSREITFTADRFTEYWEVGFIEKAPGKRTTYGISGSGNELQVFSFVIESMKLFISLYSPEKIIFSADKDDRNRGRLYLRMLQRISIPGYKIEHHTEWHGQVFTLTRTT